MISVGRPLIRVAETSSTMDLASSLAASGAPSGTAVLAGHQTEGRGRSGRTWNAEPWSSILLSFIVRTRHDLLAIGALSPLIGLAVAETVEECSNHPALVKWPNDVLVGERKIAGILIVTRSQPHAGATTPCLIAGIGLNVNLSRDHLPDTATSLAHETGQSQVPGDVLDVLFGKLSDTVTRFETGDTGNLWNRLESRIACQDEWVRIEDGPRVLQGYLRGIARDGSLRIDPGTGDEIQVVAGDLTRGPRRIP